jgi:hypothetical protein
MSFKRVTAITGSWLWQATDTLRVLGGVFIEPPVDGAGGNQPASSGLTLTVIRSWS